MNPVLAEILATKQVRTMDGELLPLHSYIPEFEGRLIQAWIAMYQPVRLLEIGLACGVSSLFICDAIKDWSGIQYHIVDPYQSTHWSNIGVYNLERAGFAGRYTLQEEPSEICLPRWLAEGLTIDFAFIDGFHRLDHVLVDFFYVNRMLSVGGVVTFDDIELPSIQKLTAHLRTYPCYVELSIPESFQWHREFRVRRMMGGPLSRVIGFRKIADDERPWHWYVDF